MPVPRLSGGREISVRRASETQLMTEINCGGSRIKPIIVEITEVDGGRIAAVRLAILDGDSIWHEHQAEFVPESARGPAPEPSTAARPFAA